MNHRAFGRTDVRISEIGVGAWGMGGAQWKGGSDGEALSALKLAFDLGVDFVDTALAYGDGHSEQLVGRAIRECTKPIFVATKVPPKNRIWPAHPNARLDDVFPARYIIESTETSLRNLGLDAVDLQQAHVWNPRWTWQDEWRRAFEDLKRSGKVRFVGVSLTEHDPDSGLELVRTGLVDAVQVIYNIFDPSAAVSLFPLAREMGVAVLARVPLDEGGLTGSITETTTFPHDEFRAFYFKGDRPRQVAERVWNLQADLKGVPGDLPEIALRFCLSDPAVTSVIPGMRRECHVRNNVRTSDAGGLPPDVLALLRAHRWERNFYT
jgi:aryl-alcohol dehydrogenase-like predicted oxidoreductase